MGVGVLMTICKFSESTSDKTYEVRPDPNLQHEKTVKITCRYVRTRSSQYVLTLYAYVCTVLPPRSYYAYAYLVYTLASNIIITLVQSMHTAVCILQLEYQSMHNMHTAVLQLVLQYYIVLQYAYQSSYSSSSMHKLEYDSTSAHSTKISHDRS